MEVVLYGCRQRRGLGPLVLLIMGGGEKEKKKRREKKKKKRKKRGKKGEKGEKEEEKKKKSSSCHFIVALRCSAVCQLYQRFWLFFPLLFLRPVQASRSIL